jgi:hypothetical protein
MVLERDGISRNRGGFKFLLNYSKNDRKKDIEGGIKKRERSARRGLDG